MVFFTCIEKLPPPMGWVVLTKISCGIALAVLTTVSMLFQLVLVVMAVLAATLPGMPLVYNGQEGGLNKRLKFFDKDPIEWQRSNRAAVYAGLFDLKRRHPALSNGHEPGNLEIIDTGNPKVFAFRRIKGKDRVTVVVNLSAAPVSVTVPGKKPSHLVGWGWEIWQS